MLKLISRTAVVCSLIFAACAFRIAHGAEGIARTEVIPFSSQTLSDSEFLKGSTDHPVTIAGVLRLPKTGDTKLPAVILLHGSGGYGAYVDAWVPRLNALGIATFVVDSFSGRGLSAVADDQASLGRLAGTLDAYRALQVLAAKPRIDSQRIAIMGFSRGGQGALYSAVERFQKMYLPGEVRFAAYIALYPNCSTRYLQDDKVSSKPIRIFHGEADDFNAFKPCQDYVERLRKSGSDVELVGYPGAYHVFDWDGLKTPQFGAKSQSVRGCRIAETASGVITNLETGASFSYSDSCVAKGTTAAYNEAAANSVHRLVPEFVTKLFGLAP